MGPRDGINQQVKSDDLEEVTIDTGHREVQDDSEGEGGVADYLHSLWTQVC